MESVDVVVNGIKFTLFEQRLVLLLSFVKHVFLI